MVAENNLKIAYHTRESDGNKDYTDAIVALIDDGVDLLDPAIAGCIVGGRSYDHDGDRVKPFWVSEAGHGAMMARTILRVCPKAKFYCIRPKIISSADKGGARADVNSTALAVQAALDRKAVIISILSTVLVSDSTVEERELLESVLAKACARGVVLFCCPPDTGTTADYYPAGCKPDTFFRIGSSRTDGKIVSSAGPMGEIDFNPTDVDVASRNSSLPPVSGEANDKITLMSGSSVAAALGTGLAALLLHCFEILEFRGERFTDIASEACLSKLVYGRLKTHDGMMAASRNLGTVTEDKFINLWETLDPVIQVLEDSPRSDKEKFQCLNSFCLKLDSRDSRD